MRLEIIPNFITEAEVNELNAWVKLGIQNKWLDAGSYGAGITHLRVTSRLYPERYEYPDLVNTIMTRVKATFGIENYPVITGYRNGRDGVVVSCTHPGGFVHKHIDVGGPDNLASLRCNILTHKPDAGCQLYVDDMPVNSNVGDLHCYLVSEHYHWTTKVEGKNPRIMWMFGVHVPADDWNSGKIKAQI